MKFSALFTDDCLHTVRGSHRHKEAEGRNRRRNVRHGRDSNSLAADSGPPTIRHHREGIDFLADEFLKHINAMVWVG